MSSGIESLTDESINNYAFWALQTGLWDGHPVSLEEAPGFFGETKSRIESFLFSQDPDSFDFKKIALPLAWIGSQPYERLGLLNEIEEFRTLANGAVVPARSKNKNKVDVEHLYDLNRLRKIYDQELLKTREKLKATDLIPAEGEYKNEERSFWQKHGRQLIIAAIIVAIVVTVIVVAVYSAGTATGVVAAAAGAAISNLEDSPDDPGRPSQSGRLSHHPRRPPPAEPVPIPNSPSDPTQLPLLQPLPTLPQIIDTPQPPTSNVPWANESISYLQWRERQLQEELLASLLNKEQTVPQAIREEPVTQPTPVVPQKPNYIRQFVEQIEKKLKETASPDYIANLQTKDQRPNYGQQFANLIEEKLKETADPNYLAIVADPNYLATMELIKGRFPKKDLSDGPIDNYASQLSSQKPEAPFQDVPLLGQPDQGTVHSHCGIRNNFSSVVESGLYLKRSLDDEFAVQPHLLHSSDIIGGLTFVGLEGVDAKNKELASAGIPPTPNLFELAGAILDHSQIQRSIDYEVASLSQIAQNIIKTGKPNLKQLHITFSNGGYVFNEALKQLPPEYQDTIMVVTTGTTAIVDGKLAHKVHNFIGDKDWPSLTVNGDKAIQEAKAKGILDIIPQSETSGIVGGHYAIQPDYQREISNFTKNKIIGNYEIY